MNLSEHVTLYIYRNTKKGESLADFLLDTMHGRTPYAKFSHQFKAVELLTFYGGFVPDQLPTLDNLPARNDGNPGKKAKKPRVTEKQLLHYDMIRMIKQDTRNGELLVDLLIHVAINGKMSNSRRFISPSTRMRAAQELLTRGFGAVSPRRIPSGKNEGLGATISKRIRKDTDNGREAAAYLMDIVAGNPPHHAKPSKRKRFTPHRRVLAACELLRRLCDIRTDHITPEHIQAYWTSQTPIDAHARQTHANSRPDINRTGIDKATALAAMATKPAANNAAEAPKDPFPPRGKARMGAAPTTESTETPDASEQSNNAKPAETPAAANDHNPKDTPSNPSRPSASALNSPSNNAKPAEAPTAANDHNPKDTPSNPSRPSASALNSPSNTVKPAISEPPANPNTTPSRPTAFALNSSPQNPNPTRQQRRQAKRRQQKALRRAQRKARSP